MNTMRDEIDQYLDEYREGDRAIRNAKREYAIFEYRKWNGIKKGIRKIDLEEASG